MKRALSLLIGLVFISGCFGGSLEEAAVVSEAVPVTDSGSQTEPAQSTQSAESAVDPVLLGAESAKEATEGSEEPENKEIDYDQVRPYEVGQIMVIMYHGVEDRETASDVYHCTVKEFERDLTHFYENGYRLISVEDLASNNITVEAGKTPLIITFDDGLPSSFSLVEENGVLVPTPNCGVDIINRFCEQYPDFGKSAIFYINDSSKAFSGAGTPQERLEYLLDNGYEIGNHTVSHPTLNKLGAEEIQYQVGFLDRCVNQLVPEYKINSIAYPYGIRPAEELRQYALSGGYDGWEYSYSYGFREGASGAASAPNRIGFDPLNMPRVRSGDNEATDLWWSLRLYEEKPELRYISDGNPDRISVPAKYEENVDKASLGDKELYIY